jgi:type IV secretion system protein VirB10
VSGAAGERGVSPVASTRKPLLSKPALAVLIAGAAVSVCGFVLWRDQNPPDPAPKEALPASLGSVITYTPPPMAVAHAAAQPPPPPPAAPPQTTQPPPTPAAERHDTGMFGNRWQQPPVVATATPTVAAVPPEPRRPSMVSYYAPPPHPVAQQPAPDGTVRAAPGGGPDIAYGGTQLDGMKAGLIGDQTFLLMPGLLPCILDTAINSTFAGPIACHLPADVRPHGVTLLDRGSIVHGMYDNKVMTGQARMAVAADWIEDPATGCNIKFGNAQLSDGLGRAGIDGNVDAHIAERFGAAVALTFAENAISLAQAALSKGGNTYLSFSSGGGGVESIASEILRSQINIPPTITVSQGSAIAVFVTRPLDFSACYSLTLKDR